MSKCTLTRISILLGLASIMSSCQREGCTDSGAENYDERADVDDGSCEYSPPAFVVHVNHEVDQSPLALLNDEYTNSSQTTYTVHRLQYYLSSIQLVGSSLASEKVDYHYSDFKEKGNYTVELREADFGTYDSLVMLFGLPLKLNKSHELPNSLENINMQWPDILGGGYHFMKFEGRYTDTSKQEKGFNLHMGKLQHDDKTTNPVIRFSFPLDEVKYSGDTWHLNLTMNLNEWFQGHDTYDFGKFGSAIMMNHEAQKLLKLNGTDVFKLTKVWEATE